jgi:hypothetical protein
VIIDVAPNRGEKVLREMKKELEDWSRTYNGWEVEVTLNFGLKNFMFQMIQPQYYGRDCGVIEDCVSPPSALPPPRFSR